MLVNVGGFGHTGNTALLNFLEDTGAFIPFARNYSETSVFRSRLGLGEMSRCLNKKFRPPLAPTYFKAGLLGLEKDYPGHIEKGIRNIINRNKNIRLQWGSQYESAVLNLLEMYQSWYEADASKQAVLTSIKGFCESVRSLSKKSHKHLLLRNDPAGYEPRLLNFNILDSFLIMVRDPVDVCGEWIIFYDKEVTKPGVIRFIEQFNKKVKRFMRQVDQLDINFTKIISVISFENFVCDDSSREIVLDRLGIVDRKYQVDCKFLPDESRKNVGVGRGILGHDLSDLVAERTKKYYEFLLRYKEI